MHKSAWDLMKLKFVSKIIAAHEQQQHSLSPGNNDHKHEIASPVSFIMSFLGSSVAAGHDSYFNQSYPVLVGQTMKPVFDALGIQLVSRNVALGNNPCMPYDICVKIFAGLDADIVQWEQTYNCGDSPILEQFVRQVWYRAILRPFFRFFYYYYYYYYYYNFYYYYFYFYLT